METITKGDKKIRIATIPQFAAMKSVDVGKVQTWAKQNRITTLTHHGNLVVDLEASQELKETEPDQNQLPSTEVPLELFLETAYASTHKSQASRRKWQIISFVSLLLFAAALYSLFWINMSMQTLRADQGKLQVQKYQLTEQVNSANTKLTELNSRLNIFRSRNNDLNIENTILQMQNNSLSSKVKSINQSKVDSKSKYPNPEPQNYQTISPQTKPIPFEKARLESIQQGMYPQDMTKQELIASVGEPDRSYQGDIYEQLVYFDRSPGRFWFKKGPYLHDLSE